MSLLSNKLVQRAALAGFNAWEDTDSFEAWIEWMHDRKSWRDISRHGKPYLERAFIVSKSAYNDATFLHVFRDSDLDGLHDHPWPWERLILKGSYWEEHHDGTRDLCGPGHYVSRSARELHRVEVEDGPVWTIFRHGPRERRWGFLDPRRPVSVPMPKLEEPETINELDIWAAFWEAVPRRDRPPKTGWLFPRQLT